MLLLLSSNVILWCASVTVVKLISELEAIERPAHFDVTGAYKFDFDANDLTIDSALWRITTWSNAIG